MGMFAKCGWICELDCWAIVFSILRNSILLDLCLKYVINVYEII